MKKAWLLSKLYINSIYGITHFVYDLKNNRKSALKVVAFIMLIVFSMSGTVAMFVALNVKMYDLLKPINQQGMVITMTIIMASLMTFVFGITGIVATYFVDKEGDILLSMPIKGWQILVAKFTTNYVYEAMISLFIMGTGFVVYGTKSGEGPIFYIASVLVALLVPVIPMVIVYFLVIPLMRAGSILRNKDFTMIMSGILVMVFVFAIQYLSQTMVNIKTDPALIVKRLASEDGLVPLAGKIYFPSIWATYAITGVMTAKGIVNYISFAVVSLGLAGVLVASMSAVYATSIEGSQEVTKKKKFTSGEFKQNLSVKSQFAALVSREIKMMNREPVYFLNGPLIILLLPAIIGFSLFMQKGNIGNDIGKLTSMPNASYYATLVIAAISVFMAVSVNITSTCISREGKAFEALKAMPVNVSKFLAAKLVHGMIFGVLGILMCDTIGFFVLKLPLANAVLAFLIAFLVALPIQIAGILMELTWPKLIWDNPQKAMKQNLNGVVIIFGAMFLIGIVGIAIYNYVNVAVYGYVMLTIVPLIISIVLYKLLMRYGTKQFYNIEV